MNVIVADSFENWILLTPEDELLVTKICQIFLLDIIICFKQPLFNITYLHFKTLLCQVLQYYLPKSLVSMLVALR